MTFSTIETSAESRRPVEIYTFQRDFSAFRYTSADRDITLGEFTYAAKPISRSSIEQSSEMQRRAIKLTVPRDLEVADMYRISPPSSVVTCLIQQFHYGDTDARVVWSGRILGVEWDGSTALLTMEPVYTAMRRVGLRRAYQKQCPHVLFSPACGANAAAYLAYGPATAISGLTISITAAATQANGYWTGGYIEYPIEDGLVERRFITGHAGSTLTLSSPATGAAEGVLVNIYPGCDHALTTCDGKFSNSVNYGGMPYFTRKNPFGGIDGPVY